jgi:hypothetical protein
MNYPLGIDSLQDERVEVFHSREQFEKATGKPCPPWDPKARSKNWIWKGAIPQDQDFIVVNIMGKAADGSACIRPYTLAVEVLPLVNLLPNTTLPNDLPPAYPMPVRALKDGEYLAPGVLGVTQVRNHADDGNIQVPFTAGDRSLLQRIAAKLGA